MQDLRQSFLNTQKEYTPIPFWFWNDELTEKEIIRQIHDFHEKGVDGFVIHPRIGIPEEIEYLSDTFMSFVSCAVQEAQKLEMKVVLYDEAMYPSGSAHGMVVKSNPEYASKGLRVLEYPCQGKINQELTLADGENIISVQAVQKRTETEINPDSIQTIESFDNKISFEAKEEENWSVLVFVQAFTKGHIRGIHFGEDDGEPYAPASGDLLNKAAMEEFIRLTHERYYEVIKPYFGNTIIGMFTDEPCIMGRGDMEGFIPWTGGFLDYYEKQGNSELDLPFLWFEAGELSERKRRKYEAAVNKKMEDSYYRPIYEWCEKHQIAQTGHPHDSDDIGFLKYFHIPAQDVVWRWVAPENGLAIEGEHSTMAKCTSDSARHRGVRRNGNECFACCGRDGIEWNFPADDMKWYMDWLFVRGVNLLYPHAFYYSIEGERRSGERPPDVGPNNIWWSNYIQISDYIKRMSFLMTDSVNQTKIAVLCGAHELPWKMVKPLYENQLEFNYLENELFISEVCAVEAGKIKIAAQEYTVLLIEDEALIDKENDKKLQRFIDGGGIVFLNRNKKAESLIRNFKPVSSFESLPENIGSVIDRAFVLDAKAPDLRISHIVKDNTEFYVLVNEGEEEIERTAAIASVGELEEWDAFEGTIKEADIIQRVGEGSMDICLKMGRREAKVLSVNPKKAPVICKKKAEEKDEYELTQNWQMGSSLDLLKKMETLTPWNEMESLFGYSGTLLYRTTFKSEEVGKHGQVELDLGEVKELAKVTVNKKEAGIKMWAPYQFDITDLVTDGENEIVIEVTNTRANEICGLNLRSGLIGPVRLKLTEE
ncbi:glycosylhydrolase-like jelly roll fold domain-containing protein [Konateibacter massiliensis]|uniref:glycosylhydrolase-like jelly roll fold domain-containing protein n=1 Tax=Konateibacter massiliensis TaxID=2002841 RepID=UPI000C15B4D3|nr:glycosylhydrolase-like jelly roll fold domain-containing protein [Konateibacter massiliensis]